MPSRLQIRTRTAALWTSSNATLYKGEFGYETDTGNIKVGVAANELWNDTPYLGATLPDITTTETDLNNIGDTGRYYIASAVTLTNVPAAPMAIVALDGAGLLLVTRFGADTVQILRTEGDGSTRGHKAWSRLYDSGAAAWRAWRADIVWGETSAIGVDLVARSALIKSGLTVEGNIAVTGTSTLTGAVGIAGIASFAAGAVATPSIARTGDLDTGIWFPAADTVAVTAAGVSRLTVDTASATFTVPTIHTVAKFSTGSVGAPSVASSATTTTGIHFPSGTSAVIGLSGVAKLTVAPTLVTLANALAVNGIISGILEGSAATDAMRLDDLFAHSAISLCYLTADSTSTSSTSAANWELDAGTIGGVLVKNVSTPLASGYKWYGLVLAFVGAGTLNAVSVKGSGLANRDLVVPVTTANRTAVLVLAIRKT